MEWKEVRLGDYIEFNPKRSLKKSTIAKKVTMDLLVPYSKQIYKYIVEPYNGGAKFQNGDTIMARITPCLENGKHSYVNFLEEDEIAFGSTEYIVMCGKPNITDNEFVYYFSHTPFFKNTAIKSMVGTSGRQRAQVDVLTELCVNFPVNIADQKKIAGILSSLDDKIGTNNRLSEKLEELAQAIFKSWFVDFEPFKNQKFHETELGMIPEGWEVGKLSDIADITMGQSPDGKSYNQDGNGFVFYQGRTEFGYRYPSVKLYTTEPKRYAEPFSVLLSVRAPVGDINIATQKCCIGRGLASISSKYNSQSFVLYSMKALRSELDRFNGEGTVFGSINKKSLENLKVIVPPKEIIESFEEKVNAIDVRLFDVFNETSYLAELRDLLLPKLMSGEINLSGLSQTYLQ